MGLPISTELYLRKFVNDLGTPTGESGLTYTQDSFTGDGSTPAFALSHVPSSSFPILVYLGSNPLVLQTSGYTVTSSTLTFSTPPGVSVAILVVYQY